MKKLFLVLSAVSSAIFTGAQAAEIGHYNGGIFDIRDYFLPEQPGFYGALYNYGYTTDRLNNGNGDKIHSVGVGPVPVSLDVNLNMYALMPVFMYVSPCEVLGARYGAYVAPSFANLSLEANLAIGNRIGGSLGNSTFAPGDLFVQPLWLDWGKPHWDFSLAYGFYAPVGKYNTRTFPLPGGTSATLESPSNVGLGYWTQQAQGGIAWYPMTNKATAVTAALTYNYNGEKRDIQDKPGQMLTLNWGISQFLPLSSSHKLLLEAGPAGYDTWQITDSAGAEAVLPNSRSQVHAVGGEVSLVYVPWSAFLTLHGYYQYATQNSFQGASVSLNLGMKF